MAKKVGRPKKPQGMKRDTDVRVKVTRSEFERYVRAWQQTGIDEWSDWLRGILDAEADRVLGKEAK